MSTDKAAQAAKKSELFAAYRVKAAEAREIESARLQNENEAGAIVDEIVKVGGPGPYKLDGNLVKARKKGEHHQFSVIPLDGAETV